MCFDFPVVLITRPAEASARFEALLQQHTQRFTTVISPAFEIAPTETRAPVFDAAIFTSRAGVACADAGQGRAAWCVGRATAEAAHDKGYAARSADGNAGDLLDMILAQRPAGRLCHIRGENARGSLRERLTAAGLDCVNWVAYRKAPQKPTQVARALDASRQLLILPLFSAETVTILANSSLRLAGATVVAISSEVEQAAKRLNPQNIVLSRKSDQVSMAQAVAGLIA